MLKYPTDKELEEWEAQAKGDKAWTLQEGQTKNAILRLIAALLEEHAQKTVCCHSHLGASGDYGGDGVPLAFVVEEE